LVHIIRDFQKDQKENLNYFAEDLLKKNNLTHEALKNIANGQPIPDGFRNLIRFYHGKADDYRCQTTEVLKKLKDKIEPKYYLSLRIIFELYLQIFERIDVDQGSFTEEELVPKPREIKERIENMVLGKEPVCL
jgi:phytoene/squalene synthetase